METAFKIHSKEGGLVRLDLPQEIESESALTLDTRLRDIESNPGVRCILVNAKNTGYIGDEGVRRIAESARRMTARGGKLIVVVGANAQLAHSFYAADAPIKVETRLSDAAA
jgi:anti-anti-sigma regulatory factor